MELNKDLLIAVGGGAIAGLIIAMLLQRHAGIAYKSQLHDQATKAASTTPDKSLQMRLVAANDDYAKITGVEWALIIAGGVGAGLGAYAILAGLTKNPAIAKWGGAAVAIGASIGIAHLLQKQDENKLINLISQTSTGAQAIYNSSAASLYAGNQMRGGMYPSAMHPPALSLTALSPSQVTAVNPGISIYKNDLPQTNKTGNKPDRREGKIPRAPRPGLA